MRVLTNDDATVHALARAGLESEALAWRDRLSFGPLSDAADLDAFFELRATVFEDAGWDEYRIASADFALWRENLNDAWESGEELVLLFGRGLDDQLKIGWLVDWIATRHATRAEEARLATPLRALSELEDEFVLAAAKGSEGLGSVGVDLYRRFWHAAAGSNPAVWSGLAADLRAQDAFPALRSAVERWLQEFPSVDNGLSITECQILDAINLGVTVPNDFFQAVQETEDPAFRRDWEFWPILNRLAYGSDALIRIESGGEFLCPPRALAWTAFHDQRLGLTEAGRAVLRGDLDAFELKLPPRWLGGLLLEDPLGCRFDYGKRRLVGGAFEVPGASSR